MSNLERNRPSWSVTIDGVRGAAAVLVVLEHLRRFFFVSYPHVYHHSVYTQIGYGLCSLGSPAVMVFFVLSGYLISGSIFRMHARGIWSWPVYGTHRLVRLYIVLLPALAIAAVWDMVGQKFYGQSAVYLGSGALHAIVGEPIKFHDTVPIWLGNALFLQGIRCPVFGSDGPLWSLSYEFWYYLLFPILLLAVVKDQSWRMRLIYLSVAGAICLLVGHGIVADFAIWLMGCAVAVLEMCGMTWRGGGGRLGNQDWAWSFSAQSQPLM